MSRQEMEKLLGGYATGTLTAEEREALFAAALEDQQLFDALAREQALRDLLSDPAARAQALAALEPERRRFAWLPRPAFAGVAFAAVACAVAVVIVTRPKPETQIAMVKVATPPPAQQVAAPVQPAPVPRVMRPPASKPKKAEAPAVREVQPPPALAAQDIAPAPPRVASTAAPAEPPRRAPTARELYLGNAAVQDFALARSSFATTQESGGVVGGVIGKPPGAAPPPPAGAGIRTYGMQRAAPRRVETAAKTQAPELPSTANLGIRWRVLRKRPDGAWAASSGPFPKGEALRLGIEPNDAGHLYVLERDGERWTPLFHDRVERRREYLVPASGVLKYDSPGTRQLLIVLARQELGAVRPETLPERAITQAVDSSVYAVTTDPDLMGQRVAARLSLEIK